MHLAVELTLTSELGDLGKKVHTGRSRNDQVAVDLRLFAKEQLLHTLEEVATLAEVLVRFGKKNETVPMVGRHTCNWGCLRVWAFGPRLTQKVC